MTSSYKNINNCGWGYGLRGIFDFVFYQAGVDVLADDRLGRINLTMNGLYERERFVIEVLFNRQLPTVITMGGGYVPDIDVIVQGHSVVFGVVGEIFRLPV